MGKITGMMTGGMMGGQGGAAGMMGGLLQKKQNNDQKFQMQRDNEQYIQNNVPLVGTQQPQQMGVPINPNTQPMFLQQ